MDEKLWMKNIYKSKYFDETTYTMYNKLGDMSEHVSAMMRYFIMQTKAGQQPYWICTFHTGIFQLPLMVMLHTTVSKQFNGARSHILRDAEFESVDESKIMLYEKLCLLYHNAKQISWYLLHMYIMTRL